MKIAISGKGGVGKTTLAGSLALAFAKQGKNVLAVDADPASSLASSLGIDPKQAGKITPLAMMKDFINERTETQTGTYGSFFKINPKVDDIPERFVILHKGVRLLVLGTVEKGGGGCFCPENVLLKTLITHLLLTEQDIVILDMEAGLEHLGRATTRAVDFLIVVIEPGQRSIQVAKKIQDLAKQIGIKKIFLVGNKIANAEDKDVIINELEGEEHFLGFLPYDLNIKSADLHGTAPFEVAGDEFINQIQNIMNKLNL